METNTKEMLLITSIEKHLRAALAGMTRLSNEGHRSKGGSGEEANTKHTIAQRLHV